MNTFKLNPISLKYIHADTGMDGRFIANADTSVIDRNIEKRSGSKLKPALFIGNISPRGSVYLMLKRFFTDNFINGKLKKIKA